MPADAAEVFEQNLAELGDAERVRWKRHPIANGETLSDIAIIYHTTVAQLKAANKLKGTQIRAGKFLMIPIASRARTQYTLSASQRKQATQNTIREGKSRVEHSVRAGDSFWEISRKYAVDMHSLAKWNGMAVRDPLREGQKLVVWVNPRSDTPQASASIDSGPASSEMLRTISYTVRSGDSLSRIADRYNVSINDIHRWNSINGKYLQPGQKLKLFIDVRNQST
jgi:membrane-bound lytic murein transglycosylase D